jgi:CRP-like cAMP-binding protein
VTVAALMPTEALELDAPNFERLAKAYPILHRVIARLLSERLRATEAGVGQSLPS